MSFHLLCRAGDHNLLDRNEAELSSDPEEAKLSYYREETLYQVFHALFHKMYAALEKATIFKRPKELFYYTHQQMIRR